MSVYYNLKKNSSPTDNQEERIQFENFLEKKTIENMSDYSVGVKRFKLPAGNVDFYRIYENRHHIGYYSSAGRYTKNTATSGANPNVVGVSTNKIIDVFGDYAEPYSVSYQYFGSGTLNTHFKDNEYNEATLSDNSDTPKRDGYYIPVRDNDDYCAILTRALNQSIVAGLDGTNQQATANYNATSRTRQHIGTSVNIDATNPGKIDPDWQTVATLPASSDFKAGVADWKVAITDFTPSNFIKFSDLQFRINVVNTLGDHLFFDLGGGYYPGIDDKTVATWSDHTTQTIQLGLGILSFSAFARLSSDYAKVNPLKNGFDKLDVRVYPQSNADLFNLMYRNIGQASVKLEVRTQRLNARVGTMLSPNAGERLYSIAGAITIIENTQIARIFRQNKDGYKEQLQAAPCFKWNDTLQKIELMSMLHNFSSTALKTNADYNASSLDSKASLFFNYRLFNALGFKRGAEVSTFEESKNMFHLLAKNQTYHAGIDGGYIVDLSCGQEDFNDTDGISYIEGQDNKILTIPNASGTLGAVSYRLWREVEQSVFKRNFLYGIEITTNRLPIEGEVVGGGNSKRKILTDFEIDPSTNFRDYLIYQPQGNSVRYYPLYTEGKLEAVDISVFYIDMNGNTRPLTLPLGLSASIKLEFRPNNMIYYN